MNKFDQILNSIQNETPEPAAEAQATERVRGTLFGPGIAGAEQLKGCEDFRSLFPSYLQKTLSDARRMLLDDHLRECVACRKAFDQARGMAPKVHAMPVRTSASPTRRWAIAAAIIGTLGVTAFGMRQFIPGFLDNGPRATVQSIDGVLYRLSDKGSSPIGAGTELMGGEEIRTPGGAHAVLRLFDGSRVEMNERATLSVATNWRGTTIHLERGHIIVQAAKQKRGKLYVSTNDSQVSVVGTIFAVNKGTLGSRVSVVEGQVDVQHDNQTQSLKPGQQTTTHPSLAQVPVESEVAWSRDAAHYFALLGELSTLQKRLETIPSSGLRYQSRLLLYMPEDTKLFAAIPNMSVTLAEAKKVFDERLQFSEVLRSWWQANPRLRTEIETMIDQIQTISTFLGEEIVIFITDQDRMNGLFIAETKDGAGLKQHIDQFVQKHGGKAPFAYSIENNLIVLGENEAAVARAKAMMARGATASTPFRQRIEQSYRDGAGWLFAANLEQIVPESVIGKKEPSRKDLGLDSMQYVVLERRDIAGKTDNRVTVSFKGERQGVASWLATPGSMGTLNFVSPEATAAASIVVKQPRAIMDEVFQMFRKLDPNFDQGLALFQAETGLHPIDDLAATLGTEATLAIDGPILPVPSWKFAVEVNQPQRLEASIEKVVALANQHMDQRVPKLVHKQEQVSGRTFYVVSGGRLPTEVHYTFVDSYLVVAATRTLLTSSMQNRQTGYTLARSEKFRTQLPYNTNPNFSSVIYHNLGSTLGPVIEQFQNTFNATQAQKDSMKAIKEAPPGLIAAYAEGDRISIATSGSMFGLNIGMFAGGKNGGLFNSILQSSGKRQ
jgi:hypothetical protein